VTVLHGGVDIVLVITGIVTSSLPEAISTKLFDEATK